MLQEKFIIADRKKVEKNFPVLSLISSQFKCKAISAWLSFLSLCHHDFCNNIRLSKVISVEDQAMCLDLLDKAVCSYVTVIELEESSQYAIIENVYKIIKKLSDESIIFLRGRIIQICGEYSYHEYMSKYETSASLEQLLQHRDELFNVMKVKNLIDFSLFFLGLVLFYGGDGDFYESLALLEKELNCKYGKNIPFNKLSLCLWTLDMSFVQKMDDPLENSNEHLALLNAMRSINQETKVTASIDSRLWARDIIAWIDTEFTLFVQSVHDDSCNQFGCGLLSEGGNIVTGNAVNRFILIAQGPFVNQTDEVEFYYEMEKRDIKTYTLPDGFLWARNPETKIDILLDSIHIDTVINIIPSQCTLDERVKIIIDPYYFALIKENGEFKRFIKEQSIVDDDIVIVDERELYLNLPNFSVIIDQRGEQKLLFNKEHGYTLPRLKIKEKKIVQPVVEIANISSYFGTIRCATNMLPLRLISNLRSLTISVCENCPKETKLQVLNQIQIFENRLCSLWISNLKIIIGQSEGDYEFDDLLRIIFIYLPSDRINDPAICSSIVNDCLLRFIEKNNHYFGL